MKLTYKISEDEYLGLLVVMLRRTERTPGRILAFLMLTVVQMGWMAYTLATAGLSRRDTIILGMLSAVLALINALYRALRRARAKNALSHMKASGQILPDYWKTHTLAVDDGKVLLQFGGVRLEAVSGDIGPVVETEELLLLLSGGKVFDAVPTSAFRSEEEKTNFLEALRARRPSAAAAEDVPPDAVWTFHYAMGGADFVKNQIRCYRAVYFTQNMLKLFPVAKLLASIYMLYYAFAKAGSLTRIFLVLFVLFINLAAIVAATPMAKYYLLRKVPALNIPESRQMEITVWFTRDAAHVLTNGSLSVTALRDLGLCRRVSGCCAVYFGAWPALMIPDSVFAGRDAEKKFMDYVKSRALIMGAQT